MLKNILSLISVINKIQESCKEDPIPLPLLPFSFSETLLPNEFKIHKFNQMWDKLYRMMENRNKSHLLWLKLATTIKIRFQIHKVKIILLIQIKSQWKTNFRIPSSPKVLKSKGFKNNKHN